MQILKTLKGSMLKDFLFIVYLFSPTDSGFFLGVTYGFALAYKPQKPLTVCFVYHIFNLGYLQPMIKYTPCHKLYNMFCNKPFNCQMTITTVKTNTQVNEQENSMLSMPCSDVQLMS